jgi:hypothetical protein
VPPPSPRFRFSLIPFPRAQRAEDGPRVEKLGKENDALRADIFDIKNSQAKAVSDNEVFKADKDVLVQKRVFSPFVSHF